MSKVAAKKKSAVSAPANYVGLIGGISELLNAHLLLNAQRPLILDELNLKFTF